MFGDIIGWCVLGLVAGAIARLLTPGQDRMGCIGTIALGVVGSFVGGLIGHLLFGSSEGQFHPSGLIGSVIGGVIVLLLFRSKAK